VLTDHVEARHPAGHLILDDKPNLPAAMKSKLRPRLTIRAPGALCPRRRVRLGIASARSVIERIGAILTLNSSDFEVRT
jgi:hypothetical protein